MSHTYEVVQSAHCNTVGELQHYLTHFDLCTDTKYGEQHNLKCPVILDSDVVVCRESLQDIEARLLAAEEAARQAKDAVQGQADIAKLERERALAARAEAEQANKNLDSAR